MATCVPALTSFIVKCYGEKYAPVLFQMYSEERRIIECFSGVQQGDVMGQALFCMPLLPVLERIREESDPGGGAAFCPTY